MRETLPGVLHGLCGFSEGEQKKKQLSFDLRPDAATRIDVNQRMTVCVWVLAVASLSYTLVQIR